MVASFHQCLYSSPRNVFCSGKGWASLCYLPLLEVRLDKSGVICGLAETLCRHTRSSIENPVLLILDNHSSHCTLEAYKYCRENVIVVVSIPPHTSRRLQTLDVAFYGPLKTEFHRKSDLGPEKITNNKIESLSYLLQWHLKAQIVVVITPVGGKYRSKLSLQLSLPIVICYVESISNCILKD
jgi:hypothetical protein